ncbi:MAG: UbiD family decarboxylase [Euryarchaeota archaeon]|nr:UbiD family decarboxylase [Euryarchaeota archaeon]
MRSALEKDVVWEEPVSPRFEMARILLENRDRTVFFENVEGCDIPVAGNLSPTRERICAQMGTTKEDLIPFVLRAVENPLEPVIVEEAPCQERTLKDLNELPVLTHFEKDAGPYIASGIVIAEDPEYGRNASFHRMLVRDGSHLGIRVVERHLHQFFTRAEGRGEPLEVAACIGLHPAVLFAAAYSLPLGGDEMALAGAILKKPVEMVRCKTVDVEVPAAAEIVIEGRLLPGVREDEGPFVDITGTYDIVRKQPVLEVTRITARRDPIYHALLPSGAEHRIYMGLPQEPRIYAAVGKVAKVKNACLTEGGCNWLHGAVSIHKEKEGDGLAAAKAALEGHPSMKHVIVVDEDIDIFDPAQLEFALATRFQADRDTIVVKGVKGSSLDPSAAEGAVTTKVGIDATKRLDRLDSYEAARIP